MTVTKSQKLATAKLHERLAALKAQYGVQTDDIARHRADAAKLRKSAK